MRYPEAFRHGLLTFGAGGRQMRACQLDEAHQGRRCKGIAMAYQDSGYTGFIRR
jgi:hypothetical protein